VAIIGILAAIAIPQYIKYIKRSRTSNAVDHARMICNAITDWASAPNMSDGNLITYPADPLAADGAPGTVSVDGKAFKSHFPSEAGWMGAAASTTNGADQYYQYIIDVAGGVLTGSPSNPGVQGTAWSGLNGADIYGAQVQAGGLGVTSGKDLTGCKANVELVSTAY